MKGCGGEGRSCDLGWRIGVQVPGGGMGAEEDSDLVEGNHQMRVLMIGLGAEAACKVPQYLS